MTLRRTSDCWEAPDPAMPSPLQYLLQLLHVAFHHFFAVPVRW
jgi:hypothetical protein